MTDIDALIHDLRQLGGDDARDRELSDRFALVLGWVFHPFGQDMGYIHHSRWIDPTGREHPQRPLFTSDLTAIVNTLRGVDRVYSISAFPVESSAAIGQMTASTKWHYAPTPERALMIARLVMKRLEATQGDT